jgi:hypothetical protein
MILVYSRQSVTARRPPLLRAVGIETASDCKQLTVDCGARLRVSAGCTDGTVLSFVICGCPMQRCYLVRRVLIVSFLGIGTACAGYLLFLRAQAELDCARAADPSSLTPISMPAGGPIGRLDIPQINLSVAVLGDDSPGNLRRGFAKLAGQPSWVAL